VEGGRFIGANGFVIPFIKTFPLDPDWKPEPGWTARVVESTEGGYVTVWSAPEGPPPSQPSWPYWAAGVLWLLLTPLLLAWTLVNHGYDCGISLPALSFCQFTAMFVAGIIALPVWVILWEKAR